MWLYLFQFIKFSIVGISNTAISLFVYYVFILINKDFYQLGNVFGWIIGVLNSFYWNNKYVFKQNDEHSNLKRVLKSYFAYFLTFILTIVLLHIEIEFLNLSKVVCPIMNLMVTTPINFLVNKHWIFKE